MEVPAFLRRPYISIFIQLCHSTFIYIFHFRPYAPAGGDQGEGVGQGRPPRVPDTNAARRRAAVTPPP